MQNTIQRIKEINSQMKELRHYLDNAQEGIDTLDQLKKANDKIIDLTVAKKNLINEYYEKYGNALLINFDIL